MSKERAQVGIYTVVGWWDSQPNARAGRASGWGEMVGATAFALGVSFGGGLYCYTVLLGWVAGASVCAVGCDRSPPAGWHGAARQQL